MKCRPIFLALVLLAGCSEIYVRDRENTDQLPHIVKIDPPLHTFTRKEAAALVNPPGLPPFGLPESLPRTFLVLARNSHNTVNITFSSPPEALKVYMNHGITEYLLKDRTLHINIFCWQHPHVNSAEIRDVHVAWKGGARVIQLWCPPEDDE